MSTTHPSDRGQEDYNFLAYIVNILGRRDHGQEAL